LEFRIAGAKDSEFEIWRCITWREQFEIRNSKFQIGNPKFDIYADHDFLNQLLNAFRSILIIKLASAPTAARIMVLIRSPVVKLLKTVKKVPVRVPAFVVLSKYSCMEV
jgi:hypothetical protein